MGVQVCMVEYGVYWCGWVCVERCVVCMSLHGCVLVWMGVYVFVWVCVWCGWVCMGLYGCVFGVDECVCGRVYMGLYGVYLAWMGVCV